MRVTSQRRWRAIERCSGVWLALGALSCGGKTESGGDKTDGNAETSGAGGSSGPSGNSGGSGGSGGSTTASTDAASGSGGSGRVGSDVTSSSGGGTAGAASGPGVPIPFSDGWAPLSQNPLGIQGAFYTFSDAVDAGYGAGDSSIAPKSFVDAGKEVCAYGTIGQVMPGADGLPNYLAHWGAAIGFNLNQHEGQDEAYPYDATAHGVVGFSFVVSGSDPLPTRGELRFNLKVAGAVEHYCARVPAAGVNTILLTDLLESCWEHDATAPSPDPSQLQALHWQYISSSDVTYDFDICISDLRAIVEPE